VPGTHDTAISVEVCFQHFRLPGLDCAADAGTERPVGGFQIHLVDKPVDRAAIKNPSSDAKVVNDQEGQPAGVGETRLDVIPLSGKEHCALERAALQRASLNLDLGVAQDYCTPASLHEANDFV